MAELFGASESEGEAEGESVGPALRTDNEYARRYDAWREREELHKLEQKYGENPSEVALSMSSDSEDEDDEPPDVSEEQEKNFLKTLSLLKKRDPRIYDPSYKFFEKKEETVEDKIETESKEKAAPEVRSLAQAFGDSDGESEGEIFTVEKKQEEPAVTEDKLKEFLTGKVEHIGDESEKDLAALKALWSDPKLNEGEAFLRDYILNKKYLVDDEDGEEGGGAGLPLDADELEADERTVEEQGKFERAYNFRFEEPDQEYLKRYPRTVSSVRPKDERRARKRAEVSARKEEEKRRKMEEIGRMKALKLKEIQEKIAKIKEVTGNKDLAFKDEDIEGDFDPEQHDRRMQAIFDAQFYNDRDTEKPVFPDLDEELEIENWDKIYEEEISKKVESKSKDDRQHCEDADFNMDAEYDPVKARTTLMEEIQETLGKKRRNRKRKNKLAQILAQEKPKFDPARLDRTYAQYMEEYYKMDCEDVIGGDLPTRFKYRHVVPNSYGLTVEEILLADDKELNKWVPLKKTVKYRPDHVEKSEVKTYQQKAMDVELKKKIIPSLFSEIEELHEPQVTKVKKKKNKKKKNKPKDADNGDEVKLKPSTSSESNADQNLTNNEVPEENVVKKSKKKRKHTAEIAETVTIENVSEVNGAPRKKKRKNRQISENTLLSSDATCKTKPSSNVSSNAEEGTGTGKKKPKQKIKNNESVTGAAGVVGSSKKAKRKHPNENSKINTKKIKFNDKNSQKEQKNTSENPMSKLSDERLKAYGLNPKKYRSFLKYKKF